MILGSVGVFLKNKYPSELVDQLLSCYNSLKENYFLGKFKPSELEGGFFVEIVRRIIEIELFSKYIPVGTQLSNLNDNELKRYENASGDESFRLHLPKALRTIYNLRNKRGVGHLSKVSPNLIDSTFIVATCDWVLAELLRLNTSIPPDECQLLIDKLVEKKLPIIFDNGKVQRVLDHSKTIKQQILLLLYHNTKISVEDLLKFTEYKNTSRFKKIILTDLHKARLIEKDDITCEITPLGIKEVDSFMTNDL